MKKPQRIQLKRTKGFNLQEYSRSLNGLDAVKVSRPGKWGNPFKVEGDMIYVHAGYRRKVMSPWVFLCSGELERCLQLYEAVVTGKMNEAVAFAKIRVDSAHDIEYWIQHFAKLRVAELKNKNLSCFCKPGEACHVDVLLKIANE